MKLKYLIILLIGIVLISGCVQQSDGGNISKDNNTNTTIMGSGGKIAGTDQGESLSDILEKGAKINAMQYDLIITMTLKDGTKIVTTGKTWLEGSKTRIETKMKSAQGPPVEGIYINDGLVWYSYTYMPQFGKYIELSGKSPGPTTPKDLIKEQRLQISNVKTLGKEVVDGKSALVTEYTATVGGVTSTIKSWYWVEKGIPVKSQATTSEYVSVNEYKNVIIGDVEDSVFELLPDDMIVQIPGLT